MVGSMPRKIRPGTTIGFYGICARTRRARQSSTPNRGKISTTRAKKFRDARRRNDNAL
mgnify:CR=1 FL=1